MSSRYCSISIPYFFPKVNSLISNFFNLNNLHYWDNYGIILKRGVFVYAYPTPAGGGSASGGSYDLRATTYKLLPSFGTPGFSIGVLCFSLGTPGFSLGALGFSLI